MENLKQELLKLYPDRSDAINRQNDFGVLAYLKCCDGPLPSQQLMNKIKIVSTSQQFRNFFLPTESVVVIDEDQEDEYDDSFDADYYCSPNSDDLEKRKVTGSPRIRGRWFGLHEMELPSDVSSSQKSGDLEEEPQKKVLSLVNAQKHVNALIS
ncbi:hypothetical protein BGZ51_008318 [Haplosporangium sp. Z 767]|nr:hypothetical protein BGZ51_008318 [Haplosporangium sp. Z 767]